jgi:hypothetical protein
VAFLTAFFARSICSARSREPRAFGAIEAAFLSAASAFFSSIARSREKRVLGSIAASFARREIRLPAFDFGRLIDVLPACRIAVRRAEEGF